MPFFISGAWFLFALGGCQQFESRLLADAKTLFDAIKPSVTKEAPVEATYPALSSSSSPKQPLSDATQLSFPQQALELGNEKIGPEPVSMAAGETLTLGKTDQYQGFVFSLRFASQTHL
jgi:hypothetical protein